MPSEKKKRILVIEDEQSMARALQLKLEGKGFEVTAVHNGKDGLKELESSDYDAVLLDLVMPVMDGFNVLEGAKKMGNKVPILVSTNLSQAEDEKRARDLGAADFFVKSNTPINKVIDHINKIVK